MQAADAEKPQGLGRREGKRGSGRRGWGENTPEEEAGLC